VKVEQQRLVNIQHARGILGPLEVAAQPEAMLGDARNHEIVS
jgi:hypothetical protein